MVLRMSRRLTDLASLDDNMTREGFRTRIRLTGYIARRRIYMDAVELKGGASDEVDGTDRKKV